MLHPMTIPAYDYDNHSSKADKHRYFNIIRIHYTSKPQYRLTLISFNTYVNTKLICQIIPAIENKKNTKICLSHRITTKKTGKYLKPTKDIRKCT